MLDLEADRQHPRKCKRPFASGALPLTAGFAMVPSLLAAALLLMIGLPKDFFCTLFAYYVLSTLYSFRLKQVPILDTLCLAALYTLRIVAGAVAVSVPLSFWLLLFSIFFFLSLAYVKRYTELDTLRRAGKESMPGRGYHPDDLPLLLASGIVAGYLSILVLALYINSPEVMVLYNHPKVIWGLCLIGLYWISRIWMKTHRARMPDDPVVFALKDRASYLMGAVAALILLAAMH
jgi:4-hydroxybenzoate polyprenyltransferase